MILNHFTAAPNLRAIAKHGLTIGDVPTDIRRNLGRVGVWFTSSPTGTGHGLSGAPSSKTRFRLTVDVPTVSALVRWSDWARANVTSETVNNLKESAGKDGPSQWQTWFVYFGVIPPTAINACHDMDTGCEIENWADAWPVELDARAVPGFRRHVWHHQLLKRSGRYMRSVQARGKTLVF